MCPPPPDHGRANDRGIVVVGAGGLGREVVDVLLALDTPPVALVDERLSGQVVRGIRVVPLEAAGHVARRFVIGIADPRARTRLALSLTAAGLTPATIVHPRATVAPETTLAPGTVILCGAYVSSGVVIGPHGQVHYNATVGHDTVLDEAVTVLPGANVSGSVRLGEGATIGSGAVVLQGREIGAGAFVGAGAVVTRDVAPGHVVIGSPARRLR